MQKDWMKASATYTMTGVGHEDGLRRVFSNLGKDVTAQQIVDFGNILEELTNDQFTDATISETNHILAD